VLAVLVQRRGRDCCLVVVSAVTRKEALDVTGAVAAPGWRCLLLQMLQGRRNKEARLLRLITPTTGQVELMAAHDCNRGDVAAAHG
jgi:hypothetical protein